MKCALAGHWNLIALARLLHRVAAPCLLVLFTFGCGDPPPEQEGGREQARPNVEPNPRVLSAITIVPSLLVCGESVTVRGFVSGARIRIYRLGGVIGDEIGRDPEGQTIHLMAGIVLATGDSITATQEYEGTESPPSPAETVLSLLEAYPPSGRPPKPGMPFQPLHRCGIATYADNLPPGGKVRILDRVVGADPSATIGGADGVAAGESIGVAPFQLDHWVSAQSEICGILSDESDAIQVIEAPGTLPAPQTTGIYDNGQILTVNHLVNGAKVTISRGGTVIGGGGAPSDHVRFWLSTSVSDGQHLEIVQELCGVPSPTGHVDVQPCSALPAPRIAAPWPGDDTITVIDPVAGSRIRVYVGGIEIGDGGGSEVRLIRALADGEEVIVTQSFGNCTANNAWRVRVGRGLDDPTAFGSCGEPARLEYGQPQDPNRRTADVTSYFSSPDSDVTVPMNAVPLHGVVRYPHGSGPYPLVLIVHGNHDPLRPSFPGYDYLLDLFASHCMIAVSVEEDFLNGSVGGEMDARAYVLLAHLQLWREWNQTPGHEFFGKVDLNRIGLAGHSRGGEAIVAAHLLNARDHNPSNPARNFGFNIRSLYAIAPVDRQFDAGAITLQGADYFVMHGSHDGDVSDFDGQKMYNRAFPVTGPTYNRKGILFIYGANHGQWNSTWETCCDNPVTPTGALISEGDQKKLGKAYMNAFYKMSLRNEVGYKHFLAGYAGFASLPAGITRVSQYQDPARTFLDHYEEDNDRNTASLAGARNTTTDTFARHENLSLSSRFAPDFLYGESKGLILGWERSANPEYHIDLPSPAVPIPDYRFLAFHSGQTHEEPTLRNNPSANQDFSIQLRFGSLLGPEVPVSNYALLRYPIVTVRLHPRSGPLPNTKSVQRTVRIPFADLRPNPALRPRDVTQIQIKLNRRASGNIVIDEIQFTN